VASADAEIPASAPRTPTAASAVAASVMQRFMAVFLTFSRKLREPSRKSSLYLRRAVYRSAEVDLTTKPVKSGSSGNRVIRIGRTMHLT
jgi:hypothetical protein